MILLVCAVYKRRVVSNTLYFVQFKVLICAILYLEQEIKDEIKAKHELESADLAQYAVDSTLAVTHYGYCGRLKRCEVLHKFLCYNVYNYEGSTYVIF